MANWDQVVENEVSKADERTTDVNNKYDSIITDELENDQDQLKQSLFIGSQKKPEQQAQVNKLSTQFNTRPEVVEKNLDTFSQHEKRSQYDIPGMIKKTPRTAKWLSDPKNSSVAHDDVQALSKIEERADDQSLMEAMGFGFARGLYGQVLSQIGRVPGLAYDVGRLTLGPLSEKYFGVRLQDRAPENFYNNTVTRYWENKAQEYSTPESNQSIFDEVGKGNYTQAGRILAIKVAESGPITGGLAIATLTGVGIPALIGVGTLSSAQKNEELRHREDIDPDLATVGALGYGGAEAAFERLGTFSFIKKWGGSLAKKFGKQSATQVLKDMGLTLLAGGITEGTEEAATTIAQTYISYGIGEISEVDAVQMLKEAGEAALVGAVSGTTITGPSAIAGGAARMERVNQTKRAKEFFTGMMEDIEQSKTAKRDPEVLGEHVAEVTKDSPVENVYVPVEAIDQFFQREKVDPAQTLKDMGIEQEYDDAKETGGDVKIPLSKWVSHSVEKGYFQSIQDDFKFDPEGMTVNEMKAEEAEIKEQIKEAEEAAKELDSDEESDIREGISKQLVEAGVPKRQADKMAQVMRGFEVLGERSGIGAKELFERYGIKIQQGVEELTSDPNERILEQAKNSGVDGNVITVDFTKRKDGFPKDLEYMLTGEKFPSQQEIDSLNKEAKFLGKDLLGKISNQGKQFLKSFVARFGARNIVEQIEIEKAVKDSQQEKGPAYVANEKIPNIRWSPNYAAQPTGVIGEPKIQEPHPKKGNPDPLLWADSKYGATKELIKKHKDQNIPLVINTSSDLVGRSDYIEQMPFNTTVNLYLTSSSLELGKTRDLFPGNPSVQRLLTAAERLRASGVRVNIIRPSSKSIIDSLGKREANLRLGTRGGATEAELQRRVGLTVLKQENIIKENEFENKLIDEVEPEMTGPGILEKYKALPQTDGGRIVNTDDAREVSDTYNESNESRTVYLLATHRFAGFVSARAYLDRLNKKPKSDTETVMLLGGGAGAGKSTSSNQFWAEPHANAYVIYDSTMQRTEDVFARVKNALETGRRVDVNFVFTDIRDALPRIEKRFWETGRFVPPEAAVRSHMKSIETLVGLYDKYKDNDLVNFSLANNSGTEGPKEVPIEKAKDLLYNETEEELIALAQKELKDVTQEVEKRKREARERASQKREGVAEAEQREGEGTGQGLQDAQQKGPPVSDQEASKSLEESLRGRIRFGVDRQFTIDLLKNADLSTFLHESGHLYLEVMGDLAQSEDATQQIKDDYATLLQWLGVSSRDEITTEHHEKWARGFEAYLMEGKAPSNSLRKAFAAFKVWLTNIYKSVTALNVELSDDVRGVMDRLLATDAEIEAAMANVSDQPLFGRVGAFNLNDKDAERYWEAFSNAKEAASAQVTAELMSDFQKARSEFFKQERKRIEAQAIKEVNENLIYRSIGYLQKGELPDGTPIKLNKDEIIAFWGAAGFEKIKNIKGKFLYSRTEGVHPNIAAEILGFEDGDQMLTAMANAQDKAALIKEITDARMLVEHPDSLTDGTLPDEAIEAVHNEQRARLLRLEMEFLQKYHKGVLRDLTRRMIARGRSDKVIKEQARRIVAKKNWRNLTPHAFLMAERKAAKEAGKAFAKGDIDAALIAKQREILNHELYRESMRAREFYQKKIKFFKKLSRSDAKIAQSRDVDLVNAARAILAKFGIGRPDKSPESYLEKMKQYDPEQYAAAKRLVDSATEVADDYRDVPYDDFVAMAEAVEAIYDLSKSMNEMDIDGQMVEINEAVDKLEAQLNETEDISKSPRFKKSVNDKETNVDRILGIGAALTRIESWVETMDLGNFDGPFRKFIWLPVSKAVTKYRIEKVKIVKEFRDLLKEIEPSLTAEPIKAPELGDTFENKQKLLHALLHTGNKSNLQKLLRGYGWADQNADGTIDTSRWDAFITRMQAEGVLTKADYDWIQKVWDLMESQKAGLQKAHKRMYGHFFEEVTSDAIETPWGTYRGGYVPAKVNHFTNEDQAIREERDMFERNNNSFAFPTTGRGATKSRVEAYAAPLLLDLGSLQSHLDWAMKFQYIEPAVKDVMKIVGNKRFRSTLFAFNPKIAREALIPWLQRTAQQRVSVPSKEGLGKYLDGFASFLRTSAGIQIMFGNVVNAAQQFTGIAIVKEKVKAKYLKTALHDYMFNHKETMASINRKSDFMRSLQDDSVVDAFNEINEVILNPSKFKKTQNWFKKHGYFLQIATQNIVNNMAWVGAYNQAVSEGMSEDKAIQFADSVVRTTQGTFNPEDISAFEVGSPLYRMFIQFTGFFNMLGNLNASRLLTIKRTLGFKDGAGQLFHLYVFGFASVAFLSELIIHAASGEPLDDDDDGVIDDIMKMFFGSQLRQAAAMVPIVGPAAVSTFESVFGERKFYGSRFNLSPSIQFLERMGSAGETLLIKPFDSDAEIKKRDIKDVLSTLGILSGIPLTPFAKPTGYLYDYQSGEAEPTGPIDFTRGLLTGRAGVPE